MKNLISFTAYAMCLPITLILNIIYLLLYGAKNDMFNVIPRRIKVKIFGRQSLLPYNQEPSTFPGADWDKYNGRSV
jgi:hypothetical protein